MGDEIRILPEILAHIFSYLDARARVNASSVCKRWMAVFNAHPRLLDEIAIGCGGSELHTFSTMSRKFSRLIFGCVVIDFEVMLFLEKFGPQFRSLTFCNCSISEEIIMNAPGRKLSTCKRLSELKIWDSDVLGIFPHLPALKSLELFFKDEVYERDLEHLRHITPYSLSHFSIKDFVMYDHELFASGVEDFIYKRRFSLQSLEFDPEMVLDLDRLSKMDGLRLESLVLGYHKRKNTIDTICKHQSMIVALQLGYDNANCVTRRQSITFTDDDFVTICTALPRLEELSIIRCNKVNGSVAAIFGLKRLRKLELVRCHGIKTKSFRKALEGLACKGLEVLNLSQTCIGRPILSKLLALVPNLREISLSKAYDVLHAQWIECPMFLCVGCLDYYQHKNPGKKRFVRRLKELTF